MSDVEHEPNQEQQGSQAPDPHAQQLSGELDAMRNSQEVEKQRQEAAWQNYAGYGPEYQRRNDARDASRRIKIDKFGDGALTIIAQIKLDSQTGEVMDGHDTNPDAQSMKDVEAEWQKYLATTPPEQRLVIYEGMPMDPAFFGSREAAIRDSGRGDGGQLQFLAHESGVEARQVEGDNTEQVKYMEQQGIARETSALFFTLRSLAAAYNDEPVPVDISMNFYPVLAELGLGEAQAIPEDQKPAYASDPDKMSELKAKVAPFVPQWNEVLRSAGLPELVAAENGSISFATEVKNSDLLQKLDPIGQGTLSEMSRTNIAGRDRRIFNGVTEAVSEGKKPFIVFGGSHVMSLEPVMESYFGQPPK